MKTQILSILAGIALAISLGAVQAVESIQATEVTGEADIAAQVTGEADVVTQAEALPQEMLSILGDVSEGEIFLMEGQEMEASSGSRKRWRNCCGFCGRWR